MRLVHGPGGVLVGAGGSTLILTLKLGALLHGQVMPVLWDPPAG